MISTKGRYALRVMIDLAEQNSAGYIPLNEIATRQQISEKYLEIILKVLVKNKLLEVYLTVYLVSFIFSGQQS